MLHYEIVVCPQMQTANLGKTLTARNCPRSRSFVRITRLHAWKLVCLWILFASQVLWYLMNVKSVSLKNGVIWKVFVSQTFWISGTLTSNMQFSRVAYHVLFFKSFLKCFSCKDRSINLLPFCLALGNEILYIDKKTQTKQLPETRRYHVRSQDWHWTGFLSPVIQFVWELS